MAEEMHIVKLSDFEHRILVNSLADYRNDLIRDKKPTEDVNDLLLKVIDAPRRRRIGRSSNEAR